MYSYTKPPNTSVTPSSGKKYFSQDNLAMSTSHSRTGSRTWTEEELMSGSKKDEDSKSNRLMDAIKSPRYLTKGSFSDFCESCVKKKKELEDKIEILEQEKIELKEKARQPNSFKALYSEREQLREMYRRVMEQNEELIRSLETLKEENRCLNEDVRSMSQSIHSHQVVSKNLKEDLQEDESKLRELTIENDMLTAKCSSLTAENARLCVVHNHHLSQIRGLNDEVFSLNGEIIELKSQLASERARIVHLEMACEKSEHELKRLNEDLSQEMILINPRPLQSELDEVKAQLVEQVKMNETIVTAHEGLMGQLNDEVARLLKDKAELRNNLRAKEIEVNDCNEKLEEYSNALADRNKEIEGLRKELATLEKLFNEIQQEKIAVVLQLEKEVEDKAKLTTDLGKVTGELKSRDDKIASLEQKLADLHELNHLFTLLENENAALTMKVHALLEEKEDLAIHLDIVRKEHRRMKEMIDSSKEEMDKASQSFDVLTSEIKSSVTDYQQNEENLKKAVVAFNDEINRLNDMISELRQENERLVGKLGKRREKSKWLKDKLESQRGDFDRIINDLKEELVKQSPRPASVLSNYSSDTGKTISEKVSLMLAEADNLARLLDQEKEEATKVKKAIKQQKESLELKAKDWEDQIQKFRRNSEEHLHSENLMTQTSLDHKLGEESVVDLEKHAHKFDEQHILSQGELQEQDVKQKVEEEEKTSEEPTPEKGMKKRRAKGKSKPQQQLSQQHQQVQAI